MTRVEISNFFYRSPTRLPYQHLKFFNQPIKKSKLQKHAQNSNKPRCQSIDIDPYWSTTKRKKKRKLERKERAIYGLWWTKGIFSCSHLSFCRRAIKGHCRVAHSAYFHFLLSIDFLVREKEGEFLWRKKQAKQKEGLFLVIFFPFFCCKKDSSSTKKRYTTLRRHYFFSRLKLKKLQKNIKQKYQLSKITKKVQGKIELNFLKD